MGERPVGNLHAVNVFGVADETGIPDFQEIAAICGKFTCQERIATNEVVIIGEDLPVGTPQCQDRVHQVHHTGAAATGLHAVNRLGHALGIDVDRDELPRLPSEFVVIDVLRISAHTTDGHWKGDFLGCCCGPIFIFRFIHNRIVGNQQMGDAGDRCFRSNPELVNAQSLFGGNVNFETKRCAWGTSTLMWCRDELGFQRLHSDAGPIEQHPVRSIQCVVRADVDRCFLASLDGHGRRRTELTKTNGRFRRERCCQNAESGNRDGNNVKFHGAGIN